MANRTSPCDRELLRQSLEERLSERQDEELAAHLSECPACQGELQCLAADEAAWSQVGSALKQEAESARSIPPGASPATADGLGTGWDDDSDSPLDFAVDFLEPSSTAEALGRLGEIDVLEVIGRGGMGIVLKGIQSELNRPVAVKVLAPHLATSGAARRRFAREAQAAAAIVHPNVMPILSVCSSGGLPYLVMPFVACESLQQRLDRDGALDVVDVLRIGMQTARGLAAAHAQGLVHRDVKPANILLEKGVDRVLLTDFGLARAADDATLTRSGVIAGTPQFMSPEQAKGEPVDARSDLFSLGSVLYAACAGRPPFRAESTYGILRRITDSPARSLREIDPRVPDWLEGIVVRLHAKEPGQRFPSADEVADLLERCVAHVQQPATPLPGGLRPPQRRFFTTRRSIRRVAATAAVLVAAAVAAVVLNWFHADVDPHDAPSAGISVPANSNVFVPSNSEGMESQSDDRTPSWDDGIGQALDGIRRDLDRIEAEAGPLPDGSQLETGHGQGMK